MRAIAQRAGADPSLVIQHYGSKSDLFAIAARIDRGSGGDDVTGHLFDALDALAVISGPQVETILRPWLTASLDGA